MKRVAIIGVTGMVGSGIYHALEKKYHIVRVYRDTAMLAHLDRAYPSSIMHDSVIFDGKALYQAHRDGNGAQAMRVWTDSIGQIDAVINCTGIIRPPNSADQSMTFFLNGALPHLLSSVYKDRLIHISTDCVFNGKDGAPYGEESSPSPVDIYGLSKYMGEPSLHSLVLRTSLIGMELVGNSSLLGWLLSQPSNSRVPGYVNHLWSGITSVACGRVIDLILSGVAKIPRHGLVHIFGQSVSKYELLKNAAHRWRPDLSVEPIESHNPTDRRLTSVYPYNALFGIGSVDEMLTMLLPVA